MFSTWRTHYWRRWTRRITAGLALAAYLVATIGFPIPAPAGKDRSAPFPCQDHACGCRSAEQCWQHCCCFSHAEKLAWAQTNGVEPPSYAEQPVEEGWHTVRLR